MLLFVECNIAAIIFVKDYLIVKIVSLVQMVLRPYSAAVATEALAQPLQTASDSTSSAVKVKSMPSS